MESRKVESLKVEGEKELEDDRTDDEKVVLNLLKANSPIDLNELKGQTGLSYKMLDKAIKGLTKNGIAFKSNI